MNPPLTEVTESAIKRLVDQFYARVRRHPVLGPVFDAAIPEPAWPPHLEKMYAFWSSVMLTSGRYKGNPVAVHRDVAGITPPLFATWLELFEATATDMFAPEPAARFVRAAQRMPAAACYAGHAGIPAVFPARLRARLLALRGDRGARAVLALGAYARVPMAAAADDLDTPADLARLRAARVAR